MAEYQKHDYISAEKSCDLAVKSDRPNWSHYNNRGVMRFMLGDYEAALGDFRRAASFALMPGSKSESRSIRKNVYATEKILASR